MDTKSTAMHGKTIGHKLCGLEDHCSKRAEELRI